MQQFRNTSDSRRVWTHIQRADQSTLELDPGETAEELVDADSGKPLPDDFEDRFLQPALTKTEQKEKVKAEKEEKEAADKVAQETADKEAADAAAAADQGVQS